MNVTYGLLELLKAKSIGKINASELRSKAGINFKTYFAHYSKPQDVLFDIERDMVKEMEEILEKLADNPQKVNDKEIWAIRNKWLKNGLDVS